MKYPLLVTLFAALLFSCAKTAPLAPRSVQGEGWESSGGSGVACFDSEAAAKLGQRETIRTLVTLEFWESKDKNKYENAKGKTREQLLGLIRERFEKYSPIFSSRYAMVQSRIGFAQWSDDAKLPKIDDANPKLPVETTDPKCRLIQLAVRYSKSKPGYLPEARVDVDRWLFENRLDPLNQAMLILHEEIYLVAKELRHPNSDALREIVAYFFSDEMTQSITARETREAEAVRLHVKLNDALYPAGVVQDPLNFILGDYYRYFTEDPLDKPAVAPSAPGQYSRYLAFGSLLRFLRERKGKCLDENAYDEASKEEQQKLQAKCSFYSVNPALITPILKDEEAFVFSARWILDRMRLMENSENLVRWNREHPEAISDLQRGEFEKACKAVAELRLPMFQGLLDKAAAYCTRLQLKTGF